MTVVKEWLEKKGPDETFRQARRLAREYTYRLREEQRISFSEPSARHLPSIHVCRRTLPEV